MRGLEKVIKKIKIITLIFGVVIFSGCSNNSDFVELEYNYNVTNKDINFRVNSLYEHTKIMIQLASDEQLDKISLDKSFIDDEIFLSIDKKVNNMEKAYGVINVYDNDMDSRVEVLENRMDEMMDVWN